MSQKKTFDLNYFEFQVIRMKETRAWNLHEKKK